MYSPEVPPDVSLTTLRLAISKVEHKSKRKASKRALSARLISSLHRDSEIY